MAAIPTFNKRTAPPKPVNPGSQRQCVGEGTSELKCPGLLELEAVHYRGQEIPLVRKDRYPVSANEDGVWVYSDQELAMVGVDRSETGETVLLRSQLSNDGIWQKGAIFTVTGKWEDEKKAGK
jgi:hypothetical protein